MFEKLGPEARDIVVLSQEIAQSMGHGEVRGEHLLLALFERMDKELANEFADIGITYEQLFSNIQTDQLAREIKFSRESIEIHVETQILIARSQIEANRMGAKDVSVGHFLIAFEWYGYADQRNFYAWELLRRLGPEHTIRQILGDFRYRPLPIEGRNPGFDFKSAEDFKPTHEIFEDAAIAANFFNSKRVSSEYLLYALAKKPDTVAFEILDLLDLEPNELRRIILQKFKRGQLSPEKEPVFTLAMARIFDYAQKISAKSKILTIESEHFLQAIVQAGKDYDGCNAWEIICESGKHVKLENLLARHNLMIETGNLNRAKAIEQLLKEENKSKRRIKSEKFVITDYFSEQTVSVLRQAKEEALLLKQRQINPEHLFLGLLSTVTIDLAEIFSSAKPDLPGVRTMITELTAASESSQGNSEINFSQETKAVLEKSFNQSRQLGASQIEPLHILLAISNMFENKKLSGVMVNVFDQLENTSLIEKSILEFLKKEASISLTESANLENKPFFEEKNLYKIPQNFSGLSIRVVENAYSEAKRLGYPCIEPEHLLLGIAKETSSEISVHLQSRGISVHNMREELAKFKDRGPGGSSILNPSEMVKEIFRLASDEAEDIVEPEDLLGYLILSMDLTTINLLRSIGLEDMLEGAGTYAPPMVLFEFLNKSKLDSYFVSDPLKVVFRSQELARQCGHKFAGPEHLLVALLESHSDISINLLKKYGVTMKEMRQSFRKLVGIGNVYETCEILLSPNTIELLREAADLVDELDSAELKLGHLLICLLRTKPGATAELLKEYDLPADLADQIVIALSGKNEK